MVGSIHQALINQNLWGANVFFNFWLSATGFGYVLDLIGIFFFGLVMTFYLGGWGVIMLKYKTLIQSMWSFTSQCLLRNLQGILKCAKAYFLLLLFSYFNRFFVCDIKNITIRYLLREREREQTLKDIYLVLKKNWSLI